MGAWIVLSLFVAALPLLERFSEGRR